MSGKTLSISELKPHEKNPRILTEKQFERLEKTIDDLGDLSGIVFNVNNGKLVGGHMRVKVFQKLKSNIVIDHRLDKPDKQGTVALGYVEHGTRRYSYREVHFTEIQHERAMLVANKAGGDWDYEMLANNWETDWLVDEIGFEKEEFGINELPPEETEGDDEVPDAAPPITVKGDLYELGQHRLLCGDSTSLADVEKIMDGQKSDMVFSDPPYGINIVTGGKVGAEFGVAKKGNYSEVIGDDTTTTGKEFYNTCIAFGFNNFIIWGGNYFTDFLPPSSSWVIWNKRSDSGIVNTFADGELAWSDIGFPVRIHNQLWNGMIREGEKDKRVHPTQKPIDLAIFCFALLKDCKIIYDGFLGSGSTLIGCEKTNRKCCGMELDEKYCDVIVKRYVEFCKKNDRPYSVKRNGKKCDDFES